MWRREAASAPDDEALPNASVTPKSCRYGGRELAPAFWAGSLLPAPGVSTFQNTPKAKIPALAPLGERVDRNPRFHQRGRDG